MIRAAAHLNSFPGADSEGKSEVGSGRGKNGSVSEFLWWTQNVMMISACTREFGKARLPPWELRQRGCNQPDPGSAPARLCSRACGAVWGSPGPRFFLRPVPAPVPCCTRDQRVIIIRTDSTKYNVMLSDRTQRIVIA